MSKSIYEHFDAATRQLSAYAIFSGGDPVGRVVFKRASSGCRTSCFLQVWGERMAKGVANGGGYDKDSASFVHAASKLIADGGDETARRRVDSMKEVADNGRSWMDQVRALGYTVQHVID